MRITELKQLTIGQIIYRRPNPDCPKFACDEVWRLAHAYVAVCMMGPGEVDDLWDLDPPQPLLRLVPLLAGEEDGGGKLARCWGLESLNAVTDDSLWETWGEAVAALLLAVAHRISVDRDRLEWIEAASKVEAADA